MKPGEGRPAVAPDDRPTFLAHALALSALYGPGPWPNDGHPLPDHRPHSEDHPLISGVVMEGIRTHHGTVQPAASTATEIGRMIERLTASPSPDPEALTALHDRLADVPALDVADALLQELARRRPPRDRVHTIGRYLAEHGTRREAVKLGIVMIGATGGEDDRDLLLLLGTLEELTLYAVVALVRTQPDRQRAAYELARRVTGWGRIHAVRRLRGTDDPEIKAWLLREGFRNGVMNEYLAHLAATTGDLHTALLDPQPDEALLDGAGAILTALILGGPAEDITDYPDAVPAMARFVELASTGAPTLGRLDALLSLARHARNPDPGFVWPEGEPERLRARLGALLDRPVWRDVVLSHLAAPVGPYGFNRALSCAGRLGVPAMPHALAHLEKDPFNAYVWQWVTRRAAAGEITGVVRLAERLLPLRTLADGPGDESGFGPEFAADRALEAVTTELGGHPGAGLSLLHAALTSRVTRLRHGAVRALAQWPADAVPEHTLDLVATAARNDPDPTVAEHMNAFLTGLESLRNG